VRILIADDDAVSRRILEAHLARWGYEVIVTRDGDEAWRVLDSADPPRIAILDWMMPGMDGVEVCRRVRSGVKEPYIYLILLTTLNGKDDLVTGMEAGADDYLAKPFRADELRVRLRAGRRIIDLQDELITARETLRAKAAHDSLTGLWNHEEIISILRRELVRAEREGKPVGALMVDIDHFKRVNDTFGHMAGDAVLRAVATRMLSVVRPYDAVGRYGGEEFLVVLPGCDREGAAVLAERFRLSIGSDSMDTPEGMIPVTISLGAAVSNRGGSDAGALVRSADLALYRAKDKGRNRVEIGLVESVETHCDVALNTEIQEHAGNGTSVTIYLPASVGE
jgi:two-component system cell cycle response regulator